MPPSAWTDEAQRSSSWRSQPRSIDWASDICCRLAVATAMRRCPGTSASWTVGDLLPDDADGAKSPFQVLSEPEGRNSIAIASNESLAKRIYSRERV
jgi:hypothetical protein